MQTTAAGASTSRPPISERIRRTVAHAKAAAPLYQSAECKRYRQVWQKLVALYKHAKMLTVAFARGVCEGIHEDLMSVPQALPHVRWWILLGTVIMLATNQH